MSKSVTQLKKEVIEFITKYPNQKRLLNVAKELGPEHGRVAGELLSEETLSLSGSRRELSLREHDK